MSKIEITGIKITSMDDLMKVMGMIEDGVPPEEIAERLGKDKVRTREMPKELQELNRVSNQSIHDLLQHAHDYFTRDDHAHGSREWAEEFFSDTQAMAHALGEEAMAELTYAITRVDSVTRRLTEAKLDTPAMRRKIRELDPDVVKFIIAGGFAVLTNYIFDHIKKMGYKPEFFIPDGTAGGTLVQFMKDAAGDNPDNIRGAELVEKQINLLTERRKLHDDIEELNRRELEIPDEVNGRVAEIERELKVSNIELKEAAAKARVEMQTPEHQKRIKLGQLLSKLAADADTPERFQAYAYAQLTMLPEDLDKPAETVAAELGGEDAQE